MICGCQSSLFGLSETRDHASGPHFAFSLVTPTAARAPYRHVTIGGGNTSEAYPSSTSDRGRDQGYGKNPGRYGGTKPARSRFRFSVASECILSPHLPAPARPTLHWRFAVAFPDVNLGDQPCTCQRYIILYQLVKYHSVADTTPSRPTSGHSVGSPLQQRPRLRHFDQSSHFVAGRRKSGQEFDEPAYQAAGQRIRPLRCRPYRASGQVCNAMPDWTFRPKA